MIYKATNLINNKIYIGRTKKSLEFRKHIHEISKDNLYFHQALRKYGIDNFKWEILDELGYENEQHYIQLHESNNREKGYNIADGGAGGDTITHNPDKNNIVSNMSKSQKEVWKKSGYREKMIKIRKEVGKRPEFLKKVSTNSLEMWKDNDERKKETSETMKNLWKDPEYRTKTLASRKNTMDTAEYRKQLSDNSLEMWKDNDERKKEASETMKNLWKDPEYRKSQLKRLTNNNPSAKTYKIIDSNNREYTITGLKNYCRDNDLPFNILFFFINKGKIPISKIKKKQMTPREKVEGWEIIRLK